MKRLRSLQGRVRHILSRTEHSGVQSETWQSSTTSTSGRSIEKSPIQSTPTIRQYRAHSAQYGPQTQYKVPWKEGVLFLSGGALGWVASRNSSASLDLSEIDLTAIKDYFRGTQSWPFELVSGPVIGPNFLADAAAKAVPAVVNISVNDPKGSLAAEKACGSGFITDPSGIIMTNAHVVTNALDSQHSTAGAKNAVAPLRIALQDGRTFEGDVLSIDRVSDLALVKISPTEALPTVKMGSSATMRVGEWVLALGSPLTLQNSVTAGIVSCVGRKAKELGLSGSTADYIQTDAAINTGSSGGPLVNMAGEVVGILSMKAMHSSGVSFAIPIDVACKLAEQLKARGRIVRPYIGIQMLQLTAENTAHMHQRDSKFPPLSQGILVPSVHSGSPAAKAGLRQGDIITGFDGANADLTIEALIQKLTQSIGQPMKLELRRGSQDLNVTITACEALN